MLDLPSCSVMMAGAQKLQNQQQQQQQQSPPPPPPPVMGPQKNNNKSVQSNHHHHQHHHSNATTISSHRDPTIALPTSIKTAALLRYNHSINNSHQYLLRNKKNRGNSCNNNSINNNNNPPNSSTHHHNNNNNEEDAINYNNATKPPPPPTRTTTTDPEIHLCGVTSRPDRTNISCDRNDPQTEVAVQITRHSWSPHVQHQQNQRNGGGGVPATLLHHQSRGEAAAAGENKKKERIGDRQRQTPRDFEEQRRARETEAATQARTTLVVTHQAPHPPPPYSIAYHSTGGNNCNASRDIDHFDQVSVRQFHQQQQQQQQDKVSRRPTTTTNTERWTENRDIEKGIVQRQSDEVEGSKGREIEGQEEENAENGGEEEDLDASEGSEGQRRRRRRRRAKPMYRSLLNYIRSAWSGVKSSSTGKRILFMAFLLLFGRSVLNSTQLNTEWPPAHKLWSFHCRLTTAIVICWVGRLAVQFLCARTLLLFSVVEIQRLAKLDINKQERGHWTGLDC